MKVGGQIPWNVTDLSAKRHKISCLMGETPHERCFGKPFEGPIIPFGSLVEYHPITAKDQSRIHQFGKKVLPDCSSDTHCAREEFGRVTYWLQTLRSWRRWTHRKSTQNKTQCKGINISPKKKENSFFQSQMDE